MAKITPRSVVSILAVLSCALSSAFGARLFRESRLPVCVQFGVNNLTDAFYLYNFESVSPGTRIRPPREVASRIVFSWSHKL